MSDVEIKIAGPSDLLNIHKFLSEFFHDKEPIERSHVDKSFKMVPDDEFLLECIDCETTLMAMKDNKLIKVLVAGKILSNEAERNIESARHLEPKKAKDILKFLSYIEAKADHCNRLKVRFCLHIHIVSVHSNCQGHGIASQLFKYCVDNGQAKNYPATSTDCTNKFTAKIAEKLGMICIATVTYEEYNQFVGETSFVPNMIHDVIKSYALLNANI